jgi:pimeloyl-ACP methyl ester carboxylesterase
MRCLSNPRSSSTETLPNLISKASAMPTVSIPAACHNDTPATCPFHVEPVTFAEAMRRFDSEAVRGTCDTGRYLCPYVTWGTGPTLVCVPGLVDDAQCFVMLLAHLSRHFRCVAYDWPTGQTDGACLSHYRHADFVADLFALLDHLGAQQVFPLGYSFGSTIVLAAMHAQPARFPRAVLLSGFARLRKLPLRNWVLHATHRAAFAHQAPEIWDHYIQRRGNLPMPALARRSLVLHHVDLRSVLPKIRQQILLICGDADPLVNKQCETELLLGLPNVARVELANCGHMAIFTHPELLAEVAAEFLACNP